MSSKLSTKCFVVIGIVAMLVATAGFANAETLLFSDNYTTASASTDINEGLGVAGNGRTAGVYETATYTKSGTVSLDGGIMTMTDDDYFWIKENFNGTDSAGGLEITVKMNVNCGTQYGGWFGLGIGNDDDSGRALTNSLMFGTRGGDPYGPASSPCDLIMCENGGPVPGVSPNWPKWSQSADGNSYNEFKYVITGVGDDNPFDGTGVLNVKLYVNGGTTAVMDYTSSEVYSNNYIGMEVNIANGSFIDEISIKNLAEVPEPATLALLVSGLIGLLAYAWRKRK